MVSHILDDLTSQLPVANPLCLSTRFIKMHKSSGGEVHAFLTSVQDGGECNFSCCGYSTSMENLSVATGVPERAYVNVWSFFMKWVKSCYSHEARALWNNELERGRSLQSSINCFDSYPSFSIQVILKARHSNAQHSAVARLLSSLSHCMLHLQGSAFWVTCIYLLTYITSH
jgi:hypothetical protein